MARDASVGRMHALMVIPGRPLRARRVQEEAHMLRHAAVDVRVPGARRLQRALSRTRGRPGPRGLVPPSYGRALICHLHNHQFRFYLRKTLPLKLFNNNRRCALLFRSPCADSDGLE